MPLTPKMVAAKTKEIDALTASIEDKTTAIGELGVQIVSMNEDLSDCEGSLLEDKKFLADLEKNCATKEEEWAIICKTRSEELLALADTIKMLNDDDALELFKKTLPGSSASFMQVSVSSSSMRTQALAILEAAKSNKKRPSGRRVLRCFTCAILSMSMPSSSSRSSMARN